MCTLILLGTLAATACLGNGLSFTVGGARVSPEQAGLAYGLSYLSELRDTLLSYRWGYFRWRPEVDLSGAPAGFGHVSIRASAVACFVHRIPRPFGDQVIMAVDTLGVEHDLTLTGGLETTPDLDRVAGLAEIGYSPWLPRGWDWLEFGVYLQGGYLDRLALADTAAPIETGPLARGRARLAAALRFPVRSPRPAELSCSAECWYDVLRRRFDYSLGVTASLFVADNWSVDVAYGRNSGAPAFEPGNVFGLGLTLRLKE